MAGHAYVAEMQTINPASVQQIVRSGSVQLNGSPMSQQAIQLSTPSVKGNTVAANVQPTTVIQPTQTHAGQQFIVTFSGEPGEQQEAVLQPSAGQQVVYQANTAGTQYVDTPSDHAIYATSNGQIQTYNDYNQATMYTPVTGTYFQTTSTGSTAQPVSMAPGLGQAAGVPNQILAHQGSTYLVQGNMMYDTDGQLFTHTSRSSPATEMVTTDRVSHFDVKSLQREVQWLLENYETAEGVSLPRSTMYYHYLRHCQEGKMDPMNPASFGKLIRSVYLGLRTRRLGTRGNSKYHYYGIRIKATSPLNEYTDEQTMALRQQPSQGKRRFKTLSHHGGSLPAGGDEAGWTATAAEGSSQQHQQFLGDASTAIPTFGQIELGDESLPLGVTLDHLEVFEVLYKEHSEAILDVVVNLQFSLIEALWQSFWRTSPMDIQQCESQSDIDQRLCKESLVSICQLKCVQEFIRSSDYSFYQALVEVLIPDVLRPIPSTLTQAIRNFAKSLEGWLRSAMQGLPDEMVKTKVASVSAFAQTLRRYTSLNHLAQAARAVLQNTTQINQMLADLNRVDFANVQEQASWVCQCDDSVVHQLEQDFKRTLQQQNSLEQWADWLEGVVNQVLRRHDDSPEFPRAARQFLLKWSFYSSMVIRDLTLRSAASFGSFHLIRLLYDEYMFYLVEHKVAAATGETSIAVMGKVGQFVDYSGTLNMDDLSGDKIPRELMPASTIGQPTSTTGQEVNVQTALLVTSQPAGSAGQDNMRTMVQSQQLGDGLPSDKKSVEMSSLLKPTSIVQPAVSTLRVVSTCPVTTKQTTLMVTTQPMTPGQVKLAASTPQIVGNSRPLVTARPAISGQAKLVTVGGVKSESMSSPTVTHVRLAGPKLAASNVKPTQTIVVVPVSVGSGDSQPMKRLKLN